ncbi:MAG TPA: hypothetical protein VFK06_00320 [Candidatus Angelobacter sp.]|nr:hypothetical protein [Candidatus Angelobacter sp.]
MYDAKIYWLHLSSSRVPGCVTTYAICRSNEPRNGLGGACPTVHYTSWTVLKNKLQHINIPEQIIDEAGQELDKIGYYLLQDIRLSHQQLVDLQFPDVVNVGLAEEGAG